MARLVVCAIGLLIAGGLGSPPAKKTVTEEEKVFGQRQVQLMTLFYPINDSVDADVNVKGWSLEDHVDHFHNASAVKIYSHMMVNGWIIPRNAPFSVLNYYHEYEAVTLFHVLFSAKNYETLYHAAYYLKDKVNYNLFVYVLSIVLLHHPETQGIVIPPIYEILPTYFNNAEIVNIAQKLTAHSVNHIQNYPACYKWEENVVIKWNETIWPYYGLCTPVWYYIHDFGLNNMYYFDQLAYPKWLGYDVVPLWKDKRGEWTWFLHKQLVSRYYAELLSNGLGEIPELGYHIVKEGFNSGLVYPNGIPFPVRNDHYHIDQPVWVEEMEKINAYELRILNVFDQGFYVDVNGQNVQVKSPEAIDVIWRLIEANVDSPNNNYYKDFISLWKKVLGNAQAHKHYYNNVVPLEVPSTLEIYQTALRDPAFYMIWKHVLDLFWTWQTKLPHYTKEELGCPAVVINQVQVDKLVTYFELDYMNVTSLLHVNEHEKQHGHEKLSVLVQYPRLNHKVFTTRVHVNSATAKKVVVKLFMAPKYDSHGHEIPLYENTKNFFIIDHFLYDLPQGESVIVRESTENQFASDDLEPGHVLYEKAVNAAHETAPFVHKHLQHMNMYPNRLLIPKGRVNGMPFVLLVHIADYLPPEVEFNYGFNPETSYGFGSGAVHLTGYPLGYPVDRPLMPWIIKGVSNLFLQDVMVYHKHTPEIYVPHHE